MNNFDRTYHDLIKDVIDNGVNRGDRTGTGTKSVFGRLVKFDLNEGFPLITTKKVWLKGIIHELLWFLDGGRNIRPLVAVGVHIWTEWPYKEYVKVVGSMEEPDWRCVMDDPKENKTRLFTMKEFEQQIITDDWFASKYGDLGPIYGAQWRNWNVGFGKAVDQIQNVINDLKNNPNSRRIMVSAWNPAEIEDMKLPPCHYAHQLNVTELTHQERYMYALRNGFLTNDICAGCNIPDTVPTHKLNLMWNQRSVNKNCALIQ